MIRLFKHHKEEAADIGAPPAHIAFIMDGNGRWAKKRGMPREYGHQTGAAVFRRLTEYCGSIGIQTVTVYALSTENFKKRPQQEINGILRLFSDYIDDAFSGLEKNRIHFRFLGDRSVFDPGTQRRMSQLEKASCQYPLNLNIAVNYGGRDELVHAVNALIDERRNTGHIDGPVTAEDIERHLYTAGTSDPDLIIRTGNEKRLSNLLIWQSAYSELFFSPKMWPDFNEHDIDEAIADFKSRKRRYGGI